MSLRMGGSVWNTSVWRAQKHPGRRFPPPEAKVAKDQTSLHKSQLKVHLPSPPWIALWAVDVYQKKKKKIDARFIQCALIML